MSINSVGGQSMELDNTNLKPFQNLEGIIILDGFFFLKNQLIKSNTPFVEEALKELYGLVSTN